MQSVIKRLTVTLVAVVALAAVAASSASAAPEWYVKKAGVYKKVTTPVEVRGPFSWEVIDTGFTFGGQESTELAISCTGEVLVELKSGGVSDINNLESVTCHRHKGCEQLESVTKERLPWQVELYKEGAEVRGRIVSGGTGTPELNFVCKWLGQVKVDQCGVNTSTHMSNLVSGFVEATFDTKSAKTDCWLGGAKKGEWKGVFGTLQPKAGTGVEAIKVE